MNWPKNVNEEHFKKSVIKRECEQVIRSVDNKKSKTENKLINNNF